MNNRINPNDEKAVIESALEAYCAEWLAGTGPDIDSYCKKFKNHERKLREAIDDFHFVAGCFPRIQNTNEDPQDEKEALGKKINDYQILREIGRGGMGVVYEVMQISLNRRVALKVLPKGLGRSMDAVKKFRREAEAGGRQSHPGIVAVYGVGEDKGEHYIVQELVGEGKTLADRIKELKEKKPLQSEYYRKAAGVIADVADALDHAHVEGVIHRDVKPNNILISKDGRIKVSDFGLAKLDGALKLSQSGDLMGTVYYMSPEQVAGSGSRVTHSTDIYSLGVTLYEMITFSLPFSGQTSSEVLQKILHQDPLDPRKISLKAPQDLVTICLKAMDKIPANRYKSMRAMEEDLRRFIHNKPIHAKPPGFFKKTIQRFHRNPKLYCAAGLALGALIGWAIFGTILVIQLDRSKRVAENEREQKERVVWNYASALSRAKDPMLSLLLAIEGVGDKSSTNLNYSENNLLSQALSSCKEKYAKFHEAPLQGVCFSPDGQLLAVASLDGSVRTWTVPDFKLELVLNGHERGVNSVAYSKDGKYLVTASDDDTAIVWNARTGDILRILDGHKDHVTYAEFHPKDSKIVVTSSKDFTARLWRHDQDEDPRMLLGHGGALTQAVFSPDGKRVATACEDGYARIFDMNSQKIVSLPEKHQGVVRSIAFHPNNNWLLTASDDQSIGFWNINEAGAPGFRLKKDSPVTYVSFCPELKCCFLAAFGDGDTEILEIEDETPTIQEIKTKAFLKRHNGRVNSASFHPKAINRLVTASEDGAWRYWDLVPYDELLCAPNDRTWKNIGISKDCQWAVRRSQDGSQVKIYSTSTKELNDTLNFRLLEVLSAHSLPNGKGIVFFLTKNRIWTWRPGKGKDSKDINYRSDIVSWDFNEAGDCCIMSLTNRNIHFLDLNNFVTRDIKEWTRLFPNKKQELQVNYVAYQPNGEGILTVLESGEAWLWDKNLDQRQLDLRALCSNVKVARFSPDGDRILLIASRANGWKGSMVNVKSGKILWEFPWKSGNPDLFSFSPDGEKILSFTNNDDGAKACVWNGRNGEMISELDMVTGPMRIAELNISGDKALAVDQDGVLKIWDVQTGVLNHKIKEKTPIRFARFSSDEEQVYYSEEVGPWRVRSIHMLALAKRSVSRGFSPDEIKEYDISPKKLFKRIENQEYSSERRHQKSRTILLDDTRKIRDYHLAKNKMLELLKRETQNHDFIITLGLAQYRLGEYEETLKRCKLASEIRTLRRLKPDPVCDLVSTMALFNMGEREEAIKQHHNYLKDKNFSQNEHSMKLEQELARLFKRYDLKHGKRTVAAINDKDVGPFLIHGVSSSKKRTSNLVLYTNNNGGEFKTLSLPKGWELKQISGNVKDNKSYSLVSKDQSQTLFIVEMDFTGWRNGGDPEFRELYEIQNKRTNGITAHPQDNLVYLTCMHKLFGTGGSEVYSLNMAENTPQLQFLIGCPGQTTNKPSISPDGKFLCYGHYPGHSQGYKQEIWIARLSQDGQCVYEPERLTANTMSDDHFRFSNDNRFLYWISSGEIGKTNQGPNSYSCVNRYEFSTREIKIIADSRNHEGTSVTHMEVSCSGVIGVSWILRGGEGNCRIDMMDSDGNLIKAISPPKGISASQISFFD